MNDLGKLAAAAMIGTLLALFVKKQQPDVALVIVLATGAIILSAALQYLTVVADFWDDLTSAASISGKVSAPLFRAVGISITIQIASALCRDSGESALAAKLELCGTAACILVMLPLLSDMLRLIADML
ncbi:MAG: stage III sporulation AC/AD family protein [Clostridiaceae bacterium]|nr:stage III sporulation AC/AD family protein [Clostridiaceae bacterium]